MTIKKQQFKSWRNRLGLSQVKAAVILVTSLSMIKKIEAGIRNASRRIEYLMWYNEEYGPPPDEINWPEA
jgi:transcriptional regulator with XRE-family HTH domain